VVEKFISVENEFSIREGILLNGFFFLKNLGLKDEKAFGLDKSDVEIEYTPLVLRPTDKINLKRLLKPKVEDPQLSQEKAPLGA
jgi:KUP system potassium uptake protein